MSNPTRQQCGENPQKRPTTGDPHPDYSRYPNTLAVFGVFGDRCVCGGIRYRHAVAPYGCDDCDCTEFHAGVELPIRQSLTDMGEPT